MSYFNRTALNVTDSGKKDKFVVTFLDGLDTVAGEKLFALCGSIVEVCGTSGTGKTTICMQVAVSVIMPQRLGGISGKVVYIDTVRTFNPARFRDILNAAMQKKKEKWNFMEGFLFYEATSLPQLFAVVIKLQHILREELQNVKLVIIDSLSNAFEELFQDFGKMVRLQNELMLHLRELVRHYKIMVIITTNQTNKALLSESYSHYVDRRLVLKRFSGSNFVATVDKMPTNHFRYFKYEIKTEGLRGIS